VLAVGAVELERAHLDQVHQAAVRVLHAQRDLHCRAVEAQLVAHLPQHLRARAAARRQARRPWPLCFARPIRATPLQPLPSRT
jgi:hypothetical protein